MSRRAFDFAAATITSMALVLAPIAPAYAGGSGGYGGHGPNCKNGGGVTVYKPVIINKNININKNIDLSKNININKNVNINKNININKTIVIDKASAVASAEAQASAAANANAGANAGATVIYSGGGYENVTVNNNYGGGGIGAVATESRCEIQEATVVKAIHAICVSEDGREFPASHMVRETWIDSSYEGEVARCIPGAHLKVVIGDVLQSDEGMAGTYQNGQSLVCADHEALRHFKDGMLKCAPAVPVPDCTERTNLRRYGTGDLFFSYRTKVCVSTRTAHSEADLSGMSLEGGVGGSSY
jgi:hypothetical protein